MSLKKNAEGSTSQKEDEVKQKKNCLIDNAERDEHGDDQIETE